MTYNYQNFLRPLNNNSKNLQIIDRYGDIKWTINPFFITNTMINNNILKINLRNDKIILLNFNNSNESKLALISLQDQIDILVQNVPQSIDKNIENYVETYVQESIQESIDEISYYDLNDIPFVLNSGVLETNLETKFNDGIKIKGEKSINWVSGTLSNILIIAHSSTESNPRISLSYDLTEDSSTFNIRTWDGTYSYDYKFNNGSIILENSGDIIRGGSSVLYRYDGTSSTPLQLPATNSIVTLITQDRLGFKKGQSVLVYNVIYNNYMDDDYIEDNGAYFVGDISGYDFISGSLELFTTRTPYFGMTNNSGIVPTYSFWNIVLSPSVN